MNRVLSRAVRVRAGGRNCSQKRCPSKADRAPASEIADRVGRSVGAGGGAGAYSHPHRLFTQPRRQLRTPQEPILRKNPMKAAIVSLKKSPAARFDMTSRCVSRNLAMVDVAKFDWAPGRLQPHTCNRYVTVMSRLCHGYRQVQSRSATSELGRRLGRSVGTLSLIHI